MRRALAASALSTLILSSLAAASPSAGEWQYQAHLVTISAGPRLVERLGHSMLAVGRVRPGRVENVVYDLGALEGEPSLLDRLGGGEQARMLRAGMMSRALAPYLKSQHRVEVQRLLIDAAELDRLRSALVAELRGRRQSYRLDLLTESPATLARDLIDQATSGALGQALAASSGPATGRELLRVELGGSIAGELLLDLFGGRRFDRPLAGRAALFLPRQLRQALLQARRGDRAFAEAPQLLQPGALPFTEPVRPSPILGWAWAGALLLLGLLAPWRTRLAGLWLLVGPVLAGLLGLLQASAVLGSSPAARGNELLLSFLLTDLLLLPLAWRWLRGRAGAGRWLRGYAALRAGAGLLVIAGHLGGFLFQQPRALLAPGLVIAALLPILVLLQQRRSTSS